MNGQIGGKGQRMQGAIIEQSCTLTALIDAAHLITHTHTHTD